MDKDMELRIVSQLSLNAKILFCSHSKDKACNYCMNKISGDVSGIYGNISSISGDVSGISGDVSHIFGDVSGISGNVSGIYGNISGISGNVSGIYGNILDIKKVLEDKKVV